MCMLLVMPACECQRTPVRLILQQIGHAAGDIPCWEASLCLDCPRRHLSSFRLVQTRHRKSAWDIAATKQR